ncbi:site-specific integrase [Candidatus Accumulibacter phosphatis]|jgi:integrase|uniref:Site-specific integrase n=1 Tax=Candidatus Accumulibacter phosphatis TaxID=327160 RepID=A0ABX1U0V9_9PROT|nr:site-specific integrase [Candidatus Accumulibacter phosphatis]NMQ28959.1 site-specific integrase [Candidatus Accumulibacter phosphatis]
MNDTAKLQFNKEKLLALPLPAVGSRSTYHDTKAPGLQLRVSASGVKTFSMYRRTKGGGPERVTLGRFPAMTVEQARKAAAMVNAEIEDGANPAQAKRVLKGEPTLTEVFAEYGRRHGEKKQAWAADQQRFRDYLQPSLGKRKLATITRAMIARTLSDAEKTGKAVATVRNIRALASSIFGKAIEWGYVDANPAQGVTISGAKVSRDRFLRSDELPRFFQSLAEEQNETLRDYILLALLTGARRANLLAMRWTEVNLKESVWRIPNTKNGTPQNVTLSPEAVTILQARQDAAESGAVFVFPGSGESGHIEEPKKAVIRVMERAGIPYGRNIPDGVTLHDLRRTLGSWQAKTGASLAIIGKSLNHKSQQATAIYARLDLDPVRASVNTATAAMMEAGGMKDAAEVLPMPKRGKA